VMYAGKVVERGTASQVFYHAKHPYTQALLRSVPRLDEEARTTLASIPGAPPDLFVPPVGCAFASRCMKTMKICLQHDSEMVHQGGGHSVSCWLYHKDNPSPPTFPIPSKGGSAE